MTAEWIAVVVAIVAVGITGTVAVNSGFRRLAGQIVAVDHRLSDVDRRVARLEGMIDTLQSVILADRRRPESGNDEGAAA